MSGNTMYDRRQLVREVAASLIKVKNVVLEEIPTKWKNIFISTDICRNFAHPDDCYEVRTRDKLIWAEKKAGKWTVYFFHPDWNPDRDRGIDGRILKTNFRVSTFQEGMDKVISFSKRNGWPLPPGLI